MNCVSAPAFFACAAAFFARAAAPFACPAVRAARRSLIAMTPPRHPGPILGRGGHIVPFYGITIPFSGTLTRDPVRVKREALRGGRNSLSVLQRLQFALGGRLGAYRSLTTMRSQGYSVPLTV